MYCDIASDMALILIQFKLKPILRALGLSELNTVNKILRYKSWILQWFSADGAEIFGGIEFLMDVKSSQYVFSMEDIPLEEKMIYQWYLITDFLTISKTFTMDPMSVFFVGSKILSLEARAQNPLPASPESFFVAKFLL